jgi:uncharacterized protein (TIGR02231 family)
MATLPISKVVVMEDRAQVERRGVLALAGGLSRWEVVGLPLVAVDRSLTVEAVGASVREARLVRRRKPSAGDGAPPSAGAAQERLRSLTDEQRRMDAEEQRTRAKREALQAARGELYRSIAERAGLGEAEPARWIAELGLLDGAQREAEDAARQAAARAAALRSEREALEAAVQRVEPHEASMECVLVLTLEGQGEATVRASYLVPCAAWRPAYRATLSEAQVLFEVEAVVWQRTGEDWRDAQLELSTARPTLGTSPPTLQTDRLRLRKKTTQEQRQVEVAVREQKIDVAGEESDGAPELPGLDDGGEARLLAVPHRVSVPSDGQAHRIPLAAFEAEAALELVAVPELSPLAFTVARFRNEGPTVLLAGPVELARSAGLVGRSQVAFTAPGETLKLSFGSEDGVRVTRELDETHDESRFTGRRTTTRQVRLYVSNMNPAARALTIEERVLVSEVKEVTVELLTRECEPQPEPPSKDGIVRLNVSLPPHGTRKARLAWTVSAAGKVTGL